MKPLKLLDFTLHDVSDLTLQLISHNLKENQLQNDF